MNTLDSWDCVGELDIQRLFIITDSQPIKSVGLSLLIFLNAAVKRVLNPVCNR